MDAGDSLEPDRDSPDAVHVPAGEGVGRGATPAGGRAKGIGRGGAEGLGGTAALHDSYDFAVRFSFERIEGEVTDVIFFAEFAAPPLVFFPPSGGVCDQTVRVGIYFDLVEPRFRIRAGTLNEEQSLV